MSHTSLWTDFYCEDMDKTHMSLDCSGSSPIDAWLKRYHDPPLHAIDRLKSVVIHGHQYNIRAVTAQLSYPAPLLESLRIEGHGELHVDNGQNVISTTLFGGDLSSLRDLYLQGIRTELPWRNMVNLTSFALVYKSGGRISVMQLLDFLESTPHLRKVQLHFSVPILGPYSG